MKTYIIHTKNGKTVKIRGTHLDVVAGSDSLLTVKNGQQYVAFLSIENIAFVAESEFVQSGR